MSCGYGLTLSNSERMCVCAPGFAVMAGITGCTPCPFGWYKSLADNSSCLPCTAGLLTQQLGSVSPVQCVCPAGLELSLGGGCTPCLPGHYKSIAGPQPCSAATPCNTNSFVSTPASPTTDQVCQRCRPGCDSGYQPQRTCPAGGVWCTACPPNTFQPAANSTDRCQPCPIVCPAGSRRVCGSALVSGCTTCEVGSYQPLAGNSTECRVCLQQCDVGLTLTGRCTPLSSPTCVAREPCPACNAGTIPGDILNQSTGCAVSCVPCPPQQYQPEPGMVSCLPCLTTCPAGSYLVGSCSSTVSPVCLACPANTYKSNPGPTPCLPCRLCYFAKCNATHDARC